MPILIFLAVLSLAALTFGGLFLFTVYDARRIGRQFPAEGRFIDVNGARVHYVDRGQGPVIFMIHGLACQWRSFSYLVDHLADDHRVIFVDRPGSGYSTVAPGASHSVRAQAEVIAGLIRALELERPTVAGHSLGGAVALALALDHPELVRNLALVAPLTQPTQTVPPAFRMFAIRPALLRHAMAWTLVVPLARLRLRQKEILRFIFHPDACPPDFEAACATPLLLRPQNFLATAADLGAASDDLPGMVTRYPGLRIPVSVLYGQGDLILDPAIHGEKLVAVVPDLRLDLVEGGHMIPVTAPGTVAAWLKAAAAR